MRASRASFFSRSSTRRSISSAASVIDTRRSSALRVSTSAVISFPVVRWGEGGGPNPPVARELPPARRGGPVAVIYRFARSADDFADEGELPAAERLARLDSYRAELDRLERGRPASPPPVQ